MTENQKKELIMQENAFTKYAKDPKKLWQAVGTAILQRPAMQPIPQTDKDGNDTLDYTIEKLSYKSLKDSLETINEDIDGTRDPTELEMILACQAQHARHSTQAATFLRDTVGAKPVDHQDSTVTVNDYSSLTDEELQMLADYRKARAGEPNVEGDGDDGCI